MEAAGVPTAAYLRLDKTTDIEAALDAFSGHPWVVKRDARRRERRGQTSDRDEAKTFIEFSIKADGYVLLEAFLPGEEATCWWSWTGQLTARCPPSGPQAGVRRRYGAQHRWYGCLLPGAGRFIRGVRQSR